MSCVQPCGNAAALCRFGGGQPRELWVGEHLECGTHMDVDKGCAL